MEDDTAKKLGSLGLIDYKIFCFNGESKFVYVSCGLETMVLHKLAF